MGPDLSTTYLGMVLRSPLVASSSPLTRTVEGLAALEDAGVAAVVLPSLFEEEVVDQVLELEDRLEAGSGVFAEASDYFPEMDYREVGPGKHVRHVERAKAALGIPVIASVNARSSGSWVMYARMLADAGADAVELNLYDVAAEEGVTSLQVEDRLVEAVRTVRAELEVPLAVKLSPYFSALPAVASRLVDAGVDGLVLFNRFYQPDIDLETLGVVPNLVLSHPSESRLSLRWIGLLRPRYPELSLAATSGVHSGDEVLKLLLAGADVTMMASALLRNGPGYVAEVEAQVYEWLAEREYVSVRQLQGSVSRAHAADPGGYERAQYIETLHSYPTPTH